MSPMTGLLIGARPTARRRPPAPQKLVVDLFAGAGGASLGIEAALGRPVDVAINHDELALEMHQVNHPGTRHMHEDVWTAEPTVVTGGRPVGLLWASPDCTHFSKAKGGRPREKRVRALAWVVIKWARAVSPDLIILENVEEFRTWGPLDAAGQPIKARAGETFRAWLACLTELGYAVEYRDLVAADYGTPTTRRRFFLIARRDGRPIVWPARTHAPRRLAAGMGLLPWVGAWTCIDWGRPCPSIFERRKELADNTLRRVARGLRRYVLESEEPFVVMCNHSGAGGLASVADPLRTITASRDAHGLVVPSMVRCAHGEACASGRRRGAGVEDLQCPLPTQTATKDYALVEAFLSKYHGQKVENGAGRCLDLAEPLRTSDTQNRFALIASSLVKMYGTCRDGQDLRQPMPTVTGNGTHIAEVRAFLTKYYGQGLGSDCRDPLHTLTAKHRMGVVTVASDEYQIVDIGLRMLEPYELLRAQFGRMAADYVLIGTKAQQVHAIGNSVPPEMAEAIVRANVGEALAA